jgi:hypothetical protein
MDDMAVQDRRRIVRPVITDTELLTVPIPSLMDRAGRYLLGAAVVGMISR